MEQNKKLKKEKQLIIHGVSIYAIALSDGIGWMRILGKGIHWKDTSKHRLYFSERNGYRKALNIGKYRLSLLH